VVPVSMTASYAPYGVLRSFSQRLLRCNCRNLDSSAVTQTADHTVVRAGLGSGMNFRYASFISSNSRIPAMYGRPDDVLQIETCLFEYTCNALQNGLPPCFSRSFSSLPCWPAMYRIRRTMAVRGQLWLCRIDERLRGIERALPPEHCLRESAIGERFHTG